MITAHTTETTKYNVKAVDRCFSIFDLAAQTQGPLTLPQVCLALGVNANMAFRLLATMVDSGYMEKNEATGTYTLSLRTLQLSRKALESVEIRRIAPPFMELLWKKFPQANINLGVLYEHEILMLARVDSQSLPRTYFTPGKTVPFHATAMGKVLVCELSDAEIDEMISLWGLKGLTNNTITDGGALKAELARVRKQNYALDREELIIHDNCNCAPIRDASGKIVAGISMSAFEEFIPVEEMDRNIHYVCETASNISYFMGYRA